jgi:hypothetical protein
LNSSHALPSGRPIHTSRIEGMVEGTTCRPGASARCFCSWKARYSCVTSKLSPESRKRPSSSQSARLQSVCTWYMLCETNSSEPPSPRKRSIQRMHLRWNDSSPTASTSSVISTSGRNAVATAKPSRTAIPEE